MHINRVDPNLKNRDKSSNKENFDNNYQENEENPEHQPEFYKFLRFHSDTVTQLAFNPNNKQLLSSSNDNTVLIWDLNNLVTKPKRAVGHKSLVNDLSVSSTGFYFATASSDETVRIWANTDDISTKDNIQSQVFKHNSAPVKSVDFSCDSKIICTGSDDKTVKIINIADKRLLANLAGHQNWVKCVRFSRDSKLIASSSDDKTVKVWDVVKKTIAYYL